MQRIDLTPPKYLQTLVENRRIFNLQNCELNIFESYQQAWHVPLLFNDFVITSMMRGKKIMHLHDKPAFEYLPGETVIVPGHEAMVIDFPEASPEAPTQCMALAVDASYIRDTLQYLDTYYNSDRHEQRQWKLQFNQYHFDNDTEVTGLINKLIRVCSSGDTGKSIYADLSLKELIIRLLQSQHLQQVDAEAGTNGNGTRLHYLLHYIHENITEKILIDSLCRKAYLGRNAFFKLFREQFGVSPLEYINNKRIKMAKQLLADTDSNITEISRQCGFTDVNYFVRLFKKAEGITPGSWQQCLRRQKQAL